MRDRLQKCKKGGEPRYLECIKLQFNGTQCLLGACQL